jgi:transcriptional regulator with XRE-family HTH domain
MAKSRYEEWTAPEGLARITELAAAMPDKELAQAMGIARSTLQVWMKKHGGIHDAVTRARAAAEAADACIKAGAEPDGETAGEAGREVEAALLRKCLGYTVTLQKAFKVREVLFDEAGKRVKETEKLEYGEETLHIPADTAAQRFWLTNRTPARWKNRQEIEGTVTTGSVEEYLQKLAENGEGEEL